MDYSEQEYRYRISGLIRSNVAHSIIGKRQKDTAIARNKIVNNQNWERIHSCVGDNTTQFGSLRVVVKVDAYDINSTKIMAPNAL